MFSTHTYEAIYLIVTDKIQRYIDQHTHDYWRQTGVARAQRLLTAVESINIWPLRVKEACLLWEIYPDFHSKLHSPKKIATMHPDITSVIRLLICIREFDFGTSSKLVDLVLSTILSLHNIDKNDLAKQEVESFLSPGPPQNPYLIAQLSSLDKIITHYQNPAAAAAASVSHKSIAPHI